MKVSTKKIIAREFLFLLGSAVICLIVYLIVYFRNSFIQNQVDNYDAQIAKTTENITLLEKTLDKKRRDTVAIIVKNRYPEYMDVSNEDIYKKIMIKYPDGFIPDLIDNEDGLPTIHRLSIPILEDTAINNLKGNRSQLYKLMNREVGKKNIRQTRDLSVF